MLLITVYDKNLERLGIIETYQELTYGRSHYGCGAFSIAINANIPNADLFSENRIIVVDNNPLKSGIITKIEKELDRNGKGDEKISISGYELKYLFARRVVWPNDGASFSLSGPAETVIKTLIDYNCGASTLDTKRRFTSLEVATDQARGGAYAISTKYTSLLDECQVAAVQGAIGWRVYPDIERKLFVVDCFVGLDRLEGQAVNPTATFSTDRDTLKSANIVADYSAYKNMIYVGGSGVGVDRVVAEGFTGAEPEDLDRFEGFADESDIADAVDLSAKALAYLEQYSKVYTMDGEALLVSPLVLDKDYTLGDLVTVKYKNATLETQIIDIVEAWTSGSYTVALTWGKDTPSIAVQVGQLAKKSTSSVSAGESGSNGAAIKNERIVYDVTSGHITQLATERIYNVLEIIGTPTGARTLTLSLDTATKEGRKRYLLVMKAVGSSFNFLLTVRSSGTRFVQISFAYPAPVESAVYEIWVDDNGDVYSSSASACLGELRSLNLSRDAYERRYNVGYDGVTGEYSKWMFRLFANGTANQKADIVFGTNYATMGIVEVELLSGYQFANATGSLKKLYSFGMTTDGASLYKNISRYTEVDENLAQHFALSEITWDAALRSAKIQIVHRSSTGNGVAVRLRIYTLQSVLGFNPSIGAVYTTDTTVFSAPYINWPRVVRARYKGVPLTAPGNIIDFQNVESDVYSTVTVGASWRFTAPRKMIYLVETVITSSSCDVSIRKNGAVYAILKAGLSGRTPFSCTIALAEGDYIDLFNEATSSASVTADVGSFVAITEMGAW